MEQLKRFEKNEEKYQTIFEIRYGIRYNNIHARFWGRMAACANFAMILFGSAAFGGYIAVEPALVGISGLLVAVIAAVSFAFDPSGKAARFELLRDKMSVLGSVAHAYKADELIHQLSILQSNILPGEFETLRNVAYNDVLRENGRDEMIEPLTKTERIFKALFA